MEGTTNYKMLTPSGRALIGLQEVINLCWFDVEALCLLSMLSSGVRQIAREGKYWRWALRDMFPRHPFQASDRKLHGVHFLSSRSAKTDNDQTADQKNFRVCLDLIHAQEVLRFTSGELNKVSCRSTASCLIVRHFEPIFREFVKYERDYAYKPNIVDCTLILDLCRPHQFSMHTISIYNDKIRSHSNFRNEADHQISHLLVDPRERHRNTPWRPRTLSDPNVNNADYVVIRCGDEPKWDLEGVAVHASRPVAIRVDVMQSNGRSHGWNELAGGAVLRPHRRADVLLKRAGKRFARQPPGKTKTVQIIGLPHPYPGDRLHSVRVTVVECGGSPVQLGLLVSQSLNKSAKANRFSLYTDRSEDFESADAYRDWWYRLQFIRRRVDRVLPVLLGGFNELNAAYSQFENAYAVADRPEIRGTDLGSVRCLLFISFIVYVVLLFIAFPIMMASNLDQIEGLARAVATGNASNTTTTYSYNMASPDPDRLVRTVCWQPDSHKALPPVVSWSVVFSPCALAIVYALTMIYMRAFEYCKIKRRVVEVYDQFVIADQRLVSVHDHVKARAEALVTEENRTAPVAVVNELAQYFMVPDITDRKTISPHFKRVHLENDFTVLNLIDASMLVISSFGIMAYAVADWWCRHDDTAVRQNATENAAALPIAAVVLCLVLDAFLAGCLIALATGNRQFNSLPCVTEFSVVIFTCVLIQQVLLLLEFFTFFHQVSFVIVFLPLIIMIASIEVYTYISHSGVGIVSLFFAVPLVIGIVLMMLKTDNLFGIGTARRTLVYYSWMLIMVPTWLIGGLTIVVIVFGFLFRYHA